MVTLETKSILEPFGTVLQISVCVHYWTLKWPGFCRTDGAALILKIPGIDFWSSCDKHDVLQMQFSVKETWPPPTLYYTNISHWGTFDQIQIRDLRKKFLIEKKSIFSEDTRDILKRSWGMCADLQLQRSEINRQEKSVSFHRESAKNVWREQS